TPARAGSPPSWWAPSPTAPCCWPSTDTDPADPVPSGRWEVGGGGGVGPPVVGLAGGGALDLFDEDQVARDLVAGQRRPHVVGQGLDGRSGALDGLHDGGHGL